MLSDGSMGWSLIVVFVSFWFFVFFFARFLRSVGRDLIKFYFECRRRIILDLDAESKKEGTKDG